MCLYDLVSFNALLVQTISVEMYGYHKRMISSKSSVAHALTLDTFFALGDGVSTYGSRALVATIVGYRRRWELTTSAPGTAEMMFFTTVASTVMCAGVNMVWVSLNRHSHLENCTGRGTTRVRYGLTLGLEYRYCGK